MGDKLRNAIGISGYWEEHEITNYKKIRRKELTSVYLIERLSKDYPADRARFLDLKLDIGDNSKEEKIILKIAKEKGKAQALVTLEKLAISRF